MQAVGEGGCGVGAEAFCCEGGAREGGLVVGLEGSFRRRSGVFGRRRWGVGFGLLFLFSQGPDLGVVVGW